MAGCGMMVPAVPANVQILFSRPESMMVSWDVGGVGYFDSEPLVVPGRSTFPTGGIYRLKVTNIEGREGVERYPTLEVGPITPRTEAYLAHNAIPIQFTDEDFDQVAAGNFVTKVIYLPDPEFQELALAGVETLVSTRLDPGIDPIVEADRRGSILAIIRMGNKDLEVPGAMDDMQGGVMQAGAIMGGGMRWRACGPYGDNCQRGCPPGTAMLPGAVVPYGNVPSLPVGRHGSAIGHADQRHADRIARSAAHSAGSPGRSAEACDDQPHAQPHSGTGPQVQDQRAAAAWIQLSRSAHADADCRTEHLSADSLRSDAFMMRTSACSSRLADGVNRTWEATPVAERRTCSSGVGYQSRLPLFRSEC